MSQTLPALEGVIILELGLTEAGQYAGRLLADLGARVITFEPRAGVASRSCEPLITDKAGQPRSIVHEYLNTGKESAGVNFETDELVSVLRSFEDKAQALLVGGSAHHLIPPDLRIPTVTTSLYGLASGRAAAPSAPLTRFQSGGSGSLMPTPRPALPGTLAAECQSGAGIVLTVLSMLLARVRGGARTPKADHSEQAHLVNLEKMFIGRISNEKAVVTRQSHRYSFGGAVRCSDGFVSMLINEKHQWKGFCEAICKPEWATDRRFATGSDRARMKDEIEAALLPWCASRTRAEVVNAMRSRQVPIGSVNEVHELTGNEILRARGFIRDAQTPYGQAAVLGLPFGVDSLWSTEGRRPFAPALGEHTEAILSDASSRSS